MLVSLTFRQWTIDSLIDMPHQKLIAPNDGIDSATFQLLVQTKILTTGVFSYLFLGRRLSSIQWMALVLLLLGVTIAQLPEKKCIVELVEDDEDPFAALTSSEEASPAASLVQAASQVASSIASSVSSTISSVEAADPLASSRHLLADKLVSVTSDGLSKVAHTPKPLLGLLACMVISLLSG
jgi:drug/metabolite transporter (DMT)-like permease